VAFGSTLAALDLHYQIEWVDPEGRHGKRLMQQFGSNQLDELAKRIAELVKNHQASRRLIIYVADPYRDRSAPLGLMLIHFNIRGLPPDPVYLDATFIWRSFEALFGPAYSWYGACHLIEDIVKKCNSYLATQEQLISQGTFTCVMLNLHLFDDDLSRSLTSEFMAAMKEGNQEE
jgi:thymidylate synthase